MCVHQGCSRCALPAVGHWLPAVGHWRHASPPTLYPCLVPPPPQKRIKHHHPDLWDLPNIFAIHYVDEKPWSQRYSEENLRYKEECDYWCGTPA